jgi:hypothetical protein
MKAGNKLETHWLAIIPTVTKWLLLPLVACVV